MVSRLFPRNPSVHYRTTIPPPGLASRVGAYRGVPGRPMDNHAWLGRHAFRESGPCASLADVNVGGPVAGGIVGRLDRPSGNITGFVNLEATSERPRRKPALPSCPDTSPTVPRPSWAD